jgi:quinol-cytochrome oxidoreductase complex cytochrome b subunit
MAQNTPIPWWQKLLVTQKAENTESGQIRKAANSLILHLHPARVPAQAIRFTYTWGLGGISALLIVMLALTGLLLMFRYDARIDYAYISIQQMESEIVFGSLIRALHHWSANLLVITTFLHLVRVYFTGSYKLGRKANWIIGLVLFFLALVANFTGYLLPWDQLAYWAITVSTSLMAYIPLIGVSLRTFMLGGPQVGQATLSNFYALHVVFVPAMILILMSYHFWKVRKNGGISQPINNSGEPAERVSTIPHLVNVEYAAALVVIAAVLLWSMANPAPLGPIANPYSSPNPAKAAWYFLGLQELLLHMHPLAALSLIGILCAALVAAPMLDKDDRDIGIYFRSPVGRRAAVLGALIGFNLTPLMVLLDEYVLDIPGWLPGLPAFIGVGLIPCFFTLGVFAAIYFFFRQIQLHDQHKANHSEALLGVFTFAVTALLILTIVGIFFRGANMALGLPF